jgi:hydrogenase nickel incorporation protein HypA/HybF
MHEEALLRDLIGKVEEVARGDPHSRVTRVRLWVGALSHFSEPALRNRWMTATRGTLAEGSHLEVTVSADPHHPRANGIILETVDLADSGGTDEPGGNA